MINKEFIANIAGYIGGTFSIIAFIPQAILTWKTKQTQGISLTSYIFFIISGSFWIVHAILLNDISMIIFTSIGGFFVVMVIIFKIKYDKQQKQIKNDDIFTKKKYNYIKYKNYDNVLKNENDKKEDILKNNPFY